MKCARHGALRQWSRFVSAMLAATLLGGCNIIGPIFFFAHGPEKVYAQYELPEDRPTVIFVDDRANTIPRRALRLMIAQTAERKLLAKDKLKDVISAQSALTAALADRSGEPLPIEAIGKAVDAEVVIYASVDEFTLSPDGSTMLPTATLSVKVLDMADRVRLWPDPGGDIDAGTITVRVSRKRGMAPESSRERVEAEQMLATLAGEALAQVFYTHEKLEDAQRQ